ncbi:hypothetical protein HDZ31DRAFT_62358 [Schizophyllum fasciatum]
MAYRDTLDLVAAASLDQLATRSRFADLACSMRALANRIRRGVATGKWDVTAEEERSHADKPCADSDVHTWEKAHGEVTVANTSASMDGNTRSQSEEEPLCTQLVTKASKTHPRDEHWNEGENAPRKRPRVTLIVRSPPTLLDGHSIGDERKEYAAEGDSEEDKGDIEDGREGEWNMQQADTSAAPSNQRNTEMGEANVAPSNSTNAHVCPTCGRTYKYAATLWNHVARHEQQALLREEWTANSATPEESDNSGAYTHPHSYSASVVPLPKKHQKKAASDHPTPSPTSMSSLDPFRPHACNFPSCGRAYTAYASLVRHWNINHGGWREC